MDKVIRLECSQTTANYRKPSAIEIQESYYLPPYSTVIGMIHTACGFTDYHPMEISIQGEYQANYIDMYTRYYFGIAYDATRHQAYTLNDKGGKDGITRGQGYTETLVDIKLIIHIKCDENDIEHIYSSLKKPTVYLALGRHEDLLKIDNVSKIEPIVQDEVETITDTYIPLKFLECVEVENSGKNTGIVFNLNKNYNPEETRRLGRRIWQKVRVKYFNKGVNVVGGNGLLFDKEKNCPIFFA